jgi:hypothetical protein
MSAPYIAYVLQVQAPLPEVAAAGRTVATRLLFDTGASEDLVIPLAVARRLHLALTPVGGALWPGEAGGLWTAYASVHLCGRAWGPVETYVVQRPWWSSAWGTPVILGMGFLMDEGLCLSVNPKAQTVTVTEACPS